MNAVQRHTLIAVAITAVSVGGGACGANFGGGSCVATSFISPTTATLDHSTAGNSQTFTTGFTYPANCSIPAVAFAYTWNVSDTIDASVTSAPGSSGTVTCNAAALNPITVYTTVPVNTTGSNPPTYIPSGLPSATLLCK